MFMLSGILAAPAGMQGRVSPWRMIDHGRGGPDGRDAGCGKEPGGLLGQIPARVSAPPGFHDRGRLKPSRGPEVSARKKVSAIMPVLVPQVAPVPRNRHARVRAGVS